MHTPKLEKLSKSGVSFYTDEVLFKETGVRIAFTCRVGGVSGSAGDLNLAGHVNDDPNAVLENRARVLAALDIAENTPIATVNQVHGNHVVVLNDGPFESCDADGIIVPAIVDDIVAMMFFADCMPVAIVTPKGDFALVHAGWRGVYSRIVLAAIETLRDLDSTLDVKECNVYIGPHIHKECFEVSQELSQDFVSEFGEEVLFGERNVSLVAAMRSTLLSAGISEQRICDIDICTTCNTDEFFSYRAEDGTCGRHALVGTRLVIEESRNDN